MFAFYVTVDSVYIKSFGRRKSWLVPVQYMIGIFLFILSYKISALIGGGFTPTKDGGEHFNYITLAQVTGVNGLSGAQYFTDLHLRSVTAMFIFVGLVAHETVHEFAECGHFL